MRVSQLAAPPLGASQVWDRRVKKGIQQVRVRLLDYKAPPWPPGPPVPPGEADAGVREEPLPDHVSRPPAAA